jgi:hypothetical protein
VDTLDTQAALQALTATEQISWLVILEYVIVLCVCMLASVGAAASEGKGPDDMSAQRHPSERESGFHEPIDFPAQEETHLLSYKNTALNNINSNHVNHRVLRGGSNSRRRLSTSPPPSLPPASSSLPQPPATPSSSTNAACSTSTSTSPNTSVPPPPPQSSPQPPMPLAFASTSSAPLLERYGPLQQPPSPPKPARSRRRKNAHDCKACGCERIRINVSGQHFETRVGLLNQHPDTLLGNHRKRQKFYDRTRDEFFIDRHRPTFEAVFAYYQYGGRLKRPHNVPDDIFLDELDFYELEREVVDEYKRNEGYVEEKVLLPTNKCMKRLWMLFEYPETSVLAFIIAVVSVIMTVTSIVLFCVETLPFNENSHCEADEAPNFLDPFFIIETICTAWFTIEVIIRFIVCPSKLGFWKDFKNIVDVTAIIPYYVTFFNVISTMSCASAKSSASLAFLRVIRLVRVFKLTKHSVGLQVLILTFKASLEGLGLFLVALVVCLLVFSSAIYYAEFGTKNSQIHSIPDAFWWAIITMTTVGYGDKVPVGPFGKIIGAVCALVGVLTLAIPVPIITGNFNRFYSHKTGRGRHI